MNYLKDLDCEKKKQLSDNCGTAVMPLSCLYIRARYGEIIQSDMYRMPVQGRRTDGNDLCSGG